MRLWSLHPRYLDPQGLVALWREGLLAQKVLQGHTKGYTKHPQLFRFSAHTLPLQAIANYLHSVVDEADIRGYRFDRTKLIPYSETRKILLTRGQLEYELEHLRQKLQRRNPTFLSKLTVEHVIKPHSLFELIDGEVEEWEKK